MLILRATLGITALAQGEIYLRENNNTSIWFSMVGLLLIASGVSLLLGFLTPLFGAFLFLGEIGTALSMFPVPSSTLLQSGLSAIYLIIIAGALFLLGPGAISLDARLFGRREIIIPETVRPTKF